MERLQVALWICNDSDDCTKFAYYSIIPSKSRLLPRRPRVADCLPLSDMAGSHCAIIESEERASGGKARVTGGRPAVRRLCSAD
ncbi:Hypothetical protein NTJ_05370 [Nesidiocoris tenuis]|uniref:Uncharacterized protein n=1 Tax=Nesidiocoris tenuis TaxID=355587 RepID=A0ABN7AJY2_9HEMI|nr:Hypothetical protein NTJ_05370 [Nesidiocoris tenuis]